MSQYWNISSSTTFFILSCSRLAYSNRWAPDLARRQRTNQNLPTVEWSIKFTVWSLAMLLSIRWGPWLPCRNIVCSTPSLLIVGDEDATTDQLTLWCKKIKIEKMSSSLFNNIRIACICLMTCFWFFISNSTSRERYLMRSICCWNIHKLLAEKINKKRAKLTMRSDAREKRGVSVFLENEPSTKERDWEMKRQETSYRIKKKGRIKHVRLAHYIHVYLDIDIKKTTRMIHWLADRQSVSPFVNPSHSKETWHRKCRK